MFAADPTPQEISTLVWGIVAVVVFVGTLLAIAVAVKTLRTPAPTGTQPVDAAQFDKHVAWAAEQNHARRDQANALTLKVAVIEQALDNGIKRRVENLEEKTELMSSKLERCLFILEGEFGGKHKRPRVAADPAPERPRNGGTDGAAPTGRAAPGRIGGKLLLTVGCQ